MDPGDFDNLARRFAFGSSRRNLLRVISGASVAGALSWLRGSSATAADKVGICHLTGSASNPVVFITVSTNAIPAHQAHGDVIDPDFENDPANCGGCLISCDDGDPCTIDTCEGGACVNTPIDCSDFDDQCIVGVCVGGLCEAQPANEGLACDDGNACTEGEVCQRGVCGGGSPVNCDDGNACTDDSCDPSSGCVYTDVICDDENACTTDSCDPAVGCVYKAVICPDDGDPCTITGCDPDDGCFSEPVVCPPGEVCFGGVCQETCENGGSCAGGFSNCGDDPDCFCFASVGGLNLCIFPRACSAVVSCNSHDDCPAGEFCLTNDCCGGTCGLACEDRPTGFAALDASDGSGGPTQAGGS